MLPSRDVGALYRRLKDDAGLAQRQIAALTGQTPDRAGWGRHGGGPIKGVGELLGDLGRLSPAPLPSRLSHVHVAQARDLAQRLREGVRAYGSDPEVSSAATATTERLLAVPGAEPVKRALLTAVAELHLHGWMGRV